MRAPGWGVFFDANTSPRLCNMIRALEEGARQIVHSNDHPGLQSGRNPRGNSTPDVVWLEVLSKEDTDWVVVSQDIRIIDTPHEREALKNSNLTFFVLDDYFANASKYGQALQLVQMWPGIVQAVEACQSGVFLVRTRKQKIEQISEGYSSKRRRM